jgi:hypothetical protein
MGAQQSAQVQQRIDAIHREIEARAVNEPPSSPGYAAFQAWEAQKLNEIATLRASLQQSNSHYRKN